MKQSHESIGASSKSTLFQETLAVSSGFYPGPEGHGLRFRFHCGQPEFASPIHVAEITNGAVASV